MFAAGSELASFWLLALLVTWALLLLGSVIANWRMPDKRQPLATGLRMASSASLTLAAWSWYLIARDVPDVALFALLLAFGMSLGFLGDLSLAELLPLRLFRQSFLVGMAAFALGHVAYIAAILSLIFARTLHMQWVIEYLALLVGLAGWYLVVFRGGVGGPALRLVALPYALVLATTAGFAAGLAMQEPLFIPLAIGGALFLISDLLVAGERFGGLRLPHISDVIWLTYGPAQMLIVFAVNSALVAAMR